MNGTELSLEPGSRHQLVGGNLAILNPSKAQDVGVYQCLATNPVGTVVSREAVLRFGCETRAGGQREAGEAPERAPRAAAPQAGWGAEPVCASSPAGVPQGGARPREDPRGLGGDAAL